MTTQSCSAMLLGASGKVYTFENDAVTDGTAGEEIQSGPSPYSLTAQSLGDYALGDTIVAGIVTAQTNAGVAYVDFGGAIASTIPVSAFGVSNKMVKLIKRFPVRAGMTLNIKTHVVATTQYYLAVETQSQSHVFAYTSSGAATGDLVSINTAQDVGRVLKQPVLCAYFTGPQDTTAAPAGAIFVNGAGEPMGFVPLSGSTKAQPEYTEFRIGVDLNTKAQIVCDA